MAQTVLITGGAGFIGRQLAAALIARGDRVRILDAFISQVHPEGPEASQVPAQAEVINGDVRDEATVLAALRGVDKVAHLAAEVGVGQSMYEVTRYTSANDLGTAVLMQALIERPVERIVVASSMSIYGEGLYRTAEGEIVEDAARRPGAESGWDPVDADGRPLTPAPTPEWKRGALCSVYAIGKFVQERLTLTVAPRYGFQAVALRLWNVFGPGQALSNPYTGVLANFAARLAHGRPPLVYEDGRQRRDFVHVADVARAFILALDHPDADGEVFNIGSGVDMTVAGVARALARAMGCSEIEPEITQRMRAGDVRHCIPDLTKAQTVLGYRAREDFSRGLAELAAWVAAQEAQDRVVDARRELELRGLVA